ncbi:MAG: VOC family protein [Bdellovibrionales bacterium]|nr:VOC family protein [Bdellovibrionales bacterium]
MDFLHTMIRVKDLDANLHFFCDLLGLQEVSRIESKQGRFSLVYLAAPGDMKSAQEKKSPLIELTYNWPNESGESESYNFSRGFGHLAFRVENIYKLCADLQNSGVIINRPPRDGWMAFVKSPEGCSVELLQKGEALPPQEPWASMDNMGSW